MKYLLAAALTAAAVLPLAATSHAASQKEPPSCSAITFRPLPDGVTDGEQEAGMYKSRFGRIAVMGQVKGGRPESYFVTINNAKLAGGALPAGVASCASQKKLPAPAASAAASCNGDRFQVLVNHVGDKRYVALYARDGSKWNYCSGGVA